MQLRSSRTAAAAIREVYNCEFVDNPQIDRALKLANELLDDAYGALNTDSLKHAPTDPALIASDCGAGGIR